MCPGLSYLPASRRQAGMVWGNEVENSTVLLKEG